MGEFTGVVSFRFQPHRVVFLVSKPKSFSFQRWTISRTCAVNSVKRTERGTSRITNHSWFLECGCSCVMCNRGSESLLAMDLIVLE
jgi:hypothetical protein